MTTIEPTYTTIKLPSSDLILHHSKVTMLWCDMGKHDMDGNVIFENWDDVYDPDDAHWSTDAAILADVYGFIASLDELDLMDYLTQYDQRGVRRDEAWAQFMHDYWLTRQGHGAGFWDRGLGRVGQALSDAAQDQGNWGIFDDHVDHPGNDRLFWFYEDQ